MMRMVGMVGVVRMMTRNLVTMPESSWSWRAARATCGNQEVDGLGHSNRENRGVPPLRYIDQYVARIVA